MNDQAQTINRFAGCVISNRDGHILLMHRPSKNVWELPGGSTESDDEPLEVTAAREVFEELGIDVEVEESIGQTSFEEHGKYYEFTWYKATILDGEPTPKQANECDKVAYFSKTALQTMPDLSTTLRELVSSW